MLTAIHHDGSEAIADEVEWGDGPFHCPECREEVILKQGRIKTPHFAHYPDSQCSYNGTGESDDHRWAKMNIYRELLTAPGVTVVQLERSLGEIRPDISFTLGDQQVAVEVQVSALSLDDIERRTCAYAYKHIAVLWTPPHPHGLYDARYAPRAWERYLHGLYFGRVYGSTTG
jgi:competence protein CoiA